MSTETTLKTKLKQIETDTLGGTRCSGTIADISEAEALPRRDAICVTVELPSGREHSQTFDVPEVASEEYAFVRLMRAAGYSLGEAPDAVGAGVAIEIGDNGPEIVVPEPTQSPRERVLGTFDRVPDEFFLTPLTVMGFLLWPVVGLRLYPRLHRARWSGSDPDWMDWAFEYVFLGCGLSLCVWGLILVALAILQHLVGAVL